MFEKSMENIADLMQDLELHFANRAKREQKTLVLSAPVDMRCALALKCQGESMIGAGIKIFLMCIYSYFLLKRVFI